MTTNALPRNTTRVPIALQVAAGMMFLHGAVTTVGAFIFFVPGTLLATATLVALIVAAVAEVTSAALLHRGQRPVWNLARAVVGAHMLFGIYKFFIYGEAESFPFLVASVLMLTLLHLPASRRYVTRRTSS